MKSMGWLMGHDVETAHDLFITPGDEDLASQMREPESLDTGADLPPCPTTKAPHTVDAGHACTVAAVLLAFLDSLPESVIPPSLYQRCCEVTSRDAAFEMLSLFPPSSVNVWISVTAFLHLLTLKSGHLAGVTDEIPEPSSPALEVTRLTDSQSHAETLASIFAPILLRDDIDLSYLAVQCYQHTRQRQFRAMECTVTQAAHFTHLPSLAFLCIVPNGIVRRSTTSHFLELFLGPFEHIFQGLNSEKDLVLAAVKGLFNSFKTITKKQAS
ncbi:hypothetical protein EDB85DRAFT_1470023 [Lactarius pseudohatsudake]|nr:hypothetical protein EDB85DRAFT_1470023 [Lactarius pseudohatsudake]